MVSLTKVIANLPPVLEPDALYAVRAGTGFDLYFTDMTGATAHKINGGSDGLPTPDRIDDSDSVYFYMGWAMLGAGWAIRRQSRASAESMDAIGTGDFDAAWNDREDLTYG